MYKPTDFNLTNAPEEMVQYVIDNVEDFVPRYKHALSIIGKDRCTLSYADCYLANDIFNAMCDWCIENDKLCILDDGIADAEEIFG